MCSVIYKVFQPLEEYRRPFVWLILKGNGLGSAVDATPTRYFHTWLQCATQGSSAPSEQERNSRS